MARTYASFVTHYFYKTDISDTARNFEQDGIFFYGFDFYSFSYKKWHKHSSKASVKLADSSMWRRMAGTDYGPAVRCRSHRRGPRRMHRRVSLTDADPITRQSQLEHTTLMSV